LKIKDLKCAVIGRHPIVRITTDEGIYGLGEVEFTKTYLKPWVLHFREALIGEDPTDVERCMLKIRQRGSFKPYGAAVSAIEHALWDIAGKAAGVPVYKLLGGKVRDRVRVYNRVTSVRTDARQALFGGPLLNQMLGKSAAVRARGIDIVLNSVRQQVMSTHCFLEHGIDPARRRAVAVKSTHHFSASFSAIAGAICYCNSPGAASMDFDRLPYRRLVRPIHPLDVQGLEVRPLYPRAATG
jgi:hypothetical protein